MLGLAKAGQVCVERGDDRTLVSEIDLDLTQVFTLFKKVRRVGMTQRMHMARLLDSAGLERQTEGALKSRAAHRFGGGGSAQSIVAP